MDNKAMHAQLLRMVDEFGDKATGQATFTVDEKEYTVNMFRQNNGLMVLAGTADDYVPEVFALSDGKRILAKSSPLRGIIYHVNMAADVDDDKPMAQRQLASFTDVVNDLKKRLQAEAEPICTQYTRSEYGDNEPLDSCVCDENPDAAIAASYWCNRTLADTGSFEALHDYVGVNVDDAVVQNKKPTFNPPRAFYSDVTEPETIAYFFNGETAFRNIVRDRFEETKKALVRTYCDYCIRLVKYNNTTRDIDEDNTSITTAMAINKAINAFNADEKYKNATKLTYTVMLDNGVTSKFRTTRYGLMTAKGLPDERWGRVPRFKSPSWFEYDRVRPEQVLEIRYVKHVVYAKTN